MASGLIEHTVMTNLRQEYESQGFDFYENPPLGALPAFLGRFQPDAIAVKGDEGVVLELKPRTAGADSLKHIAERFGGQSKWRFRVIFYDPQIDERKQVVSSTLSRPEFDSLKAKVSRLVGLGEDEAALLLGWSLLEAVYRAKSDRAPVRNLTTSQIAEGLEHIGVVDDAAGNLLRQSAAIRNAIAHGKFDLRPGTGLIDVVLQSATKLFEWRGRPV